MSLRFGQIKKPTRLEFFGELLCVIRAAASTVSAIPKGMASITMAPGQGKVRPQGTEVLT